MNHFSNQCFFKKGYQRGVKYIYQSESDNDSSYEEDEFIAKIVKTLAKQVKLIPSSRKNILLKVNIENSDIIMDPDTGSDVDIINEDDMIKLIEENPQLQEKIRAT